MSAPLPGTEFRWHYEDDSMGATVSDWHTVDGPCSSCCHGGPDTEGVHQQGAAYEEDGIMDWAGHTRCDPRDIDEGTRAEWR